jgi:hypothetical protein
VNGIVHPYTKDLYERDDATDRVRVTRYDGTIGFFASDGHWLDGAKFEADLHLCEWIMAPRNVHRLADNPAAH